MTRAFVQWAGAWLIRIVRQSKDGVEIFVSLYLIKSALGLSPRLPSLVCQSAHFESDWYRHWARRIAVGKADTDRFGDAFSAVFHHVWRAMEFVDDKPLYRHRKMWEWCAIAQVLWQSSMLKAGKRGCGFAVGHEPLTSLFAAMGAEIVATDLAASPASDWAQTGQQSQTADQIYWPHLVSEAVFRDRVSFIPVDMRSLNGIEAQKFDFLWSSCSLEHLGSLDAGMRFVEAATAHLRPGGIAVHTTEFNVSSESDTLKSGDNVIYRKSDLAEMRDRLLNHQARLRHFVFDPGRAPEDIDYDRPPFYESGRQHIKLKLGNFVATSILLVVEKDR